MRLSKSVTFILNYAHSNYQKSVSYERKPNDLWHMDKRKLSINHILNWLFLADAGGRQWFYAVVNIESKAKSSFTAESAGDGQLRTWSIV